MVLETSRDVCKVASQSNASMGGNPEVSAYIAMK